MQSQEFFEHYFDFLHLRVAVHQTLGKCVDDVKRPAKVAIGMKHDLPVVVEEFTKLIIRLADCRPITEGEADESYVLLMAVFGMWICGWIGILMIVL